MSTIPRPAISFVLGSFNRKKFLKLTIESIREEMQDFPQRYEIIVVDGGSGDGTLKWLVGQKDIVSIIQHNHGIWDGKPVARRSWGYFMNLGFKSSQGKYICMLSDDCLIVPGAVQNGYRFFENRLTRGHRVGALAFFWRNVPGPKQYWTFRVLSKALMVNHGMFLKEALEEVNYIDEDTYQFYCADGDLCLKLWHAGYQVLESPKSFVEHHAHANIKQRDRNAASASADQEMLLQRWSTEFEAIDDKQPDIHYVDYDDVYNTARKFRRARPINFQLIKVYLKRKIKNTFPNLRQNLKTLGAIKN
ncbi:MAG: glycosyltransferase [Desulfobacteraceae bacterium]|nr:glycosyltransferase [Desulfobacteraceae bacterium]